MKKAQLVIVMFLLMFAAKAQDIKNLYVFDKIHNTIEFDISKINLYEQRMYLVYQLNNDNRFDVSTNEKDGIFIIKRNDNSYSFNLEDTFISFYNEGKTAFNSMSKDEVGELFREWKSSLPDTFVASIMMDYYIKSRQNNHCADADPFCTDNGQYQFPAGVNAGSGESGPYYGCLSTTPNPAWYYMRMANPGAMTIHMYSTPSVDIDFCCWGPFDDPVTPCPSGLTQNKIVSCSYSTAATENCQIPSSAQTGQYYILIITNYSNSTCNITFSKTSGSGTTDCTIMPPLVENGGPYCVGETIRLTGNAQSGATYNWSGPGNWNATGQTVTRPNCTIGMAGTYTCTITLNGQTSSADTHVSVYANPTANFNATTVCVGNNTQFTSTSTTNPSGQQITRYNWNFGDGGTSTQQNPTHTYANAGTYNVSLTVACGENTCTNTCTKSVTVNDYPVANAGNDQNVNYQQSATLTAATVSGATYSWRPTNMIEGNANQQTVQTIPMTESTTFTLTVTRNGCSDSDDVMVGVGEQMIANISGDNNVCQNESITLHASVMGGSGNYSYQWKKNGTSVGNNSPTLTLNMTTAGTFTFTCDVSDGYSSYTATTTVIIRPLPNANAGADQNIFYDNTTTLTAEYVEDAEYSWQPANKINGNADQQTVETIPLTENTTFTLTVTKSECVSIDEITVNVGAEMTATATIENAVICYGNSTTVTALASGGTPANYQYTWQSVPNTVTFGDYHASSTSINPEQPGNYNITCVVYDGHTTVNTQVDLTVNPAENEETTIAICPSELPFILDLPDGTTETFYEGTGPEGWHATVTNLFGCNVDVSLYLTVNQVVENEFSLETCDEPYTFVDNGIVIKTLENTCTFDTVYPFGECEKHVTIHFTRNSVYDENYQGTYVSENYPEHHCYSYTWPSNGQTYTECGRYPYTFTSIHGCDSIVTLVLDENNLSFLVDPGASSAMAVDTCKNYEGCYIWGIEGQQTKIWASGNDWQYTFVGASSHGCDSIGHLNLRLYERPNIRTLTGDQQVQPGVVYMPNLYEYQILDISGAGTENDYPPTADDFTWEVLCYYNTPNRLNPNDPNDYQSIWQLDIPDPTDKTHVYLMINSEGNAVLKCTLHTICGDVSIEKFIYTEGYQEGEAVDEVNYENMVSIYPNPNNGDLYIGFSDELTSEPLLISIYNCNGSMIDQFYSNADSNVTHYSMSDMHNGMYFVRCTGNDFVITKKFVLSK